MKGKKELSHTQFRLHFTLGILDIAEHEPGKEKNCPVTVPSPLSWWWDGDLERLFSLRSFLNNRLTKVLDRCRLVLPSAERFSFCCLFFFCLSSEGGKKEDKIVWIMLNESKMSKVSIRIWYHIYMFKRIRTLDSFKSTLTTIIIKVPTDIITTVLACFPCTLLVKNK